jgi:hypothetical protein
MQKYRGAASTSGDVVSDTETESEPVDARDRFYKTPLRPKTFEINFHRQD